MVSIRAAAAVMAACGLCALPSQATPPAEFQLVDVSCTRVLTGPNRYPDPGYDQAMLGRVFGEGVKVVGIVGRKDGGWSRLPRFWASLKAWPGNGRPAVNPLSTYSLRAPDPRTGNRLWENVHAVALNIFSHGNPEVLLKVLRCPYADSSAGGCWGEYWVYAAAATDLSMELRLWDVHSRRLVTWRKGPGPAVALTDTETFLGSDCHECGQDPFC